MKETVEERAVAEKIDAQLLWDGKDTMAMNTGNEFGSHAKRTYLIVLVAAGRTEAAVTTKSYVLEIAAVRAGIHGPAIGRISAVDHLINVFNYRRSGMQKINELFIMLFKNSLEYVHVTIMNQEKKKEKPQPLKNEGQGS